MTIYNGIISMKTSLTTVAFSLTFLITMTVAVENESSASSYPSSNRIVITHGPILGRLSCDGIGVWIRTSQPTQFCVRYKPVSETASAFFAYGRTHLANDNTGWVHISGLKPNTKYLYTAQITGSGSHTPHASFTTLPDENQFRNPQHNPRGLFNFSFEFACGNCQNLKTSIGPATPAYKTMLDHLKGHIYFQILNGDWLYEEMRDTPVEKWLKDNNLSKDDIPHVVKVAPTIVGVWENYKLYLNRSKNLSTWHRYIPAFYTFDDHELLNDIYGAGQPGYRNRRTVFRDIGTQAWRDYLGWSNPLPQANPQPIHFGKADLTAGSDVLVDNNADFTQIDLDKAATLHIHWGTPTAGVHDTALDGVGGHPVAGVYEIVKVIDEHHLKINPTPKHDASHVSYSIGMQNFYQFSVSNCDFFVLDTRTHRQLHDVRNPRKKNLTMLGKQQKTWLIEQMRKSKADFLFVVSSVNLTVPHAGGWKIDAGNKDDAWTVFLDERDQLIDFWDSLNRPVFVLTGDLHNSFVIKVSERVWEFASAPHNSQNHWNTDEGNRPPSGDFEYNGRKVNIRWSTFYLNDIPRSNLRYPVYCVVQVNNVFNNPLQPGTERWIAFPQPQVVFQYYDGLTGQLKYAEAVTTNQGR